MKCDPRKGLPSASGFARLALCPGSFSLEQQCLDVPSDAAEEGTLLHAYMEQLLTGEPWAGSALSAEQVELCERAMRMLEGVLDAEGGFRLVSTEERLFYTDWLDDRLFSGQWDALYVRESDNVALVVDWKFGRVEVDSAESNRQMEALAALVANRRGCAGCYVVVVQPRVSGSASVAFYNSGDLRVAMERCEEVARGALDPDAARFCSEAACRYCRAKAVCHEACAMVEQASMITTDRDKWEVFSPDEKVKAYRLAKLAGKWKAAVEFRFEQDVAAGLIPGFEMGAGRTSFTVVDAAGAFGVLNAEFPDGMTAEAFTRCCKVGITDLDCLVHELRKAVDPKATVKSSREWLRERLAGVGEEKTTKGSVKEIGGGKA